MGDESLFQLKAKRLQNLASADINVAKPIIVTGEEHRFLVMEPMRSHVNVGSGYDLTIKELAATISRIVGYSGKIVFDTTKSDGTPRKLLDGFRVTALGLTEIIFGRPKLKLCWAMLPRPTINLDGPLKFNLTNSSLRWLEMISIVRNETL